MDHPRLLKTVSLLQSEVELLRYQANTQDLVKKKLVADSEESKQELRQKDMLIERLKEELVKQRQSNAQVSSEFERKAKDTNHELSGLRDALINQVNQKTQIFELKEKMSELQKEVDYKREMEEKGLYGNIEDSKAVRDLRRDLKIAQ